MGMSSAKKIKCSDLEDWFDDVFIVHEDKVPLSVAVEKRFLHFWGVLNVLKIGTPNYYSGGIMNLFFLD